MPNNNRRTWTPPPMPRRIGLPTGHLNRTWHRGWSLDGWRDCDARETELDRVPERHVTGRLRRPRRESRAAHSAKYAARKSKKSCEFVVPSPLKSASPAKNEVRKSKKSWELTM